MSFFITFSTKWNNIKPVLFGVAKIMMIYFCFFATFFALLSFYMGEFAKPNSIIDGRSRSGNFWMQLPESFTSYAIFLFLFWSSQISLIFFGLFMSVLTFFAITSISARTIFSDMKFRQRFDFLAFSAAFCFNIISHNQLLYSWLMVKAINRNIPVRGLLYNNTKGIILQ